MKRLEEPAAQPAAAGCILQQSFFSRGLLRKKRTSSAEIKTARPSSKLRQTAVVAFQALKEPDNRVGCLAL